MENGYTDFIITNESWINGHQIMNSAFSSSNGEHQGFYNQGIHSVPYPGPIRSGDPGYPGVPADQSPESHFHRRRKSLPAIQRVVRPNVSLGRAESGSLRHSYNRNNENIYEEIGARQSALSHSMEMSRIKSDPVHSDQIRNEHQNGYNGISNLISPRHSSHRFSPNSSDQKNKDNSGNNLSRFNNLPGYPLSPRSRKVELFRPIAPVHSLDDTDSLIELKLEKEKLTQEEVMSNSMKNLSRNIYLNRSPGNPMDFIQSTRYGDQRVIAHGRNGNGSLFFDISPNGRPFSANTFCEPAPFNSPSVTRSGRRINDFDAPRLAARPQSSSAQALRQSSIRYFRGSLKHDPTNDLRSSLDTSESRQIPNSESPKKFRRGAGIGYGSFKGTNLYSGRYSNNEPRFDGSYNPPTAAADFDTTTRDNGVIKQGDVGLNRHNNSHPEKYLSGGRVNQEPTSPTPPQTTSEFREDQLMREIEAMRREFDQQLNELKDEWQRRVHCQQQQAFRAESKLLDQIKRLQEERKAFQDKLEKTLVDNESLRRSVDSMEVDIRTNITQMDNLKKDLEQSVTSQNHLKQQLDDHLSNSLQTSADSSSSELPDDTIQKNTQLEEEIKSLKKILASKEAEMQSERGVWLDEKKKVIAYQKQLQQNYINTSELNDSLQRQMERLQSEVKRLKTELHTSSSDISK